MLSSQYSCTLEARHYGNITNRCAITQQKEEPKLALSAPAESETLVLVPPDDGQ